MIGAILGDSTIRQPSRAELRQWQRFRGWTIRILKELEHSGGMTVAEIAERVDNRRVDVKEYCRRLRMSGAVDYAEKWGYKITSTGTFILSIQTSNSSATQQQHLGNTKATLRQLTLAPFSDPQYSEPELAITNLLLSHYNTTGEKFVYIENQHALCEMLNIPPDILGATLRKLRQDGICYLWRDRDYGAYQLRLKPAFLERLKDA